MRLNQFLLPVISLFFLSSCVSSKKYKKSQSEYATLQTKHVQLETKFQTLRTNCTNEKADLTRKNEGLQNDIANLNRQVDNLKQNNTQALKQLEDMSVISSAQAESIKKSMDNIGAKGYVYPNIATTNGT